MSPSQDGLGHSGRQGFGLQAYDSVGEWLGVYHPIVKRPFNTRKRIAVDGALYPDMVTGISSLEQNYRLICKEWK